MPGRKPYEAFSSFVEPLAGALSCVGLAKPQASNGGKDTLGKVHTLHLTGVGDDGYVKLGGAHGLELRARMYYRIIRDGRDGYGPFRVSTRGYDYLSLHDRSRRNPRLSLASAGPLP
jgi:hypothetical protein